MDVLPDLLRRDLTIVFVGTAAGRRSAAVRAYYAHPGNRFWRTLHEVGLTPRCFAPTEFMQLPNLGMGFTDLAKAASGMDHEIAKSAYDCGTFADKIRHCRPRIVAFTSKKAASIFLRTATARVAYGEQTVSAVGVSRVFVLPSPSGAASKFWSITPWHELAASVRLL